ncbi:TMEM175 family protein [uncultured Arthrobacter sp.]|uniref:TMEM175 family protein n=1 Tax=uncultured Arthrobacter sp. TaxID=114050 RepID=UPI00260B923B|nr:TMEM175 family protein [uncultured Arthrobacter sp.]
MNTSRLEAFSDGVLAIIITIMVLELSAPAEPSWEGLRQVLPVFLSYLLSFAFVGIYWNNHHHLVHLAGKVNGTVLWANLHLLFWLSLIPFSTRWMQQTDFAQVPVLTYGIDLLLSAIAFLMLRVALVRQDGPDGHLARALRDDRKGKLSPLLYLVGMAATLVHPWIGLGTYAIVALMWLLPQRRIERYVAQLNE